MVDTSMTRRTALALGSMAGLAVTAGAGGIAATAQSPDLTSKAGHLQTFMRMRGVIDDGLVIGFLSGRYYGVVDNVLTPLYGLSSAYFIRYRQTSALSYEGVECEQAYYTDLQTGKPLGDWLNPYTNEIVKVPEVRSEPKPVKIDENLVFSAPILFPGAHYERSVLPPVILGNDIWFTENVIAGRQLPGKTETHRYTELTTMHARVGELASISAKTRVHCNTHFTSTVSWAPWQNMGDRAGHLLGNGDGGYSASISDLSPAWREATLRSRPELVHDPVGVLDPVWKTLGR